MTLGQIQELSLNFRKAIDEFNDNCMPDGFFLYEEPNGMLLVVNEITSEQVPIPSEFMSKNKLTSKEVEELFKNGSF